MNARLQESRCDGQNIVVIVAEADWAIRGLCLPDNCKLATIIGAGGAA